MTFGLQNWLPSQQQPQLQIAQGTLPGLSGTTPTRASPLTLDTPTLGASWPNCSLLGNSTLSNILAESMSVVGGEAEGVGAQEKAMRMTEPDTPSRQDTSKGVRDSSSSGEQST